MAKWFDQAREIERLRGENKRLLELVTRLKNHIGDDVDNLDIYGVATEERQLVTAGKTIEAIKTYRERTGADLLTAKKAIESVV